MKIQNGRYGNAPRCGRCGGRLFEESEHTGLLARSFWECSVGCGQRYESLRGDKRYPVGILPAQRHQRKAKESTVGILAK